MPCRQLLLPEFRQQRDCRPCRRLRTEVDDIVGTLDDIQIVLYHYQRMAPFYQGIEGMEQALDVVEVKTRGRLVEDEERRLLFLLTYEEGELYTLILTTRKRT